jgi:hypothetical protein
MKIKDNQSIVKVTDKNGNDIPFYDDGYGPLYVHHDQCGHFSFVSAIIRAQSFEEAYGIVEDEFLPEADESIEEIIKEYGFRRESIRVVETGNGEKYLEPGEMPADGERFVRWHTRETPDPEAWAENELFQEAFTFRPNGPKTGDIHKHGIASKNLEGVHLREVREADAEEFTIEISTEE